MKHKVLKIVLLMIALISIDVKAEDKQTILDKIVDSHPWQTGRAIDVPSWIFEPCQKNEFVAFSEAGLTEEAGKEQALCRAALLSQLEKNVQVNFMFSSYNNYQRQLWEKKDKQLRMMASIHSDSTLYYYEIIKTYYSPFKETYIKVRFKSNGENKFIHQFKMNCFMIYKQSLKHSQKIVCELYHNTSLPLMKNTQFYYEGEKSLILKSSKYQGMLLKNHLKKCWYTNYPYTHNDSTSYYKTSLNGSIWNAEFEALVRCILVHNYSISKTQLASEKYNTSKIKNLTRVIGKQDINLIINLIGVYKNKLITTINLSEILEK